MSRFSRIEVLNEVLQIGLMPLFYEQEVDTARRALDACLQGGARLVEFTSG